MFDEVLQDYIHLLKQGIPFIINVDNKKVFDGNLAEIKEQMTKEEWIELLSLKCTEHRYNVTFQTAVFELTKEGK